MTNIFAFANSHGLVLEDLYLLAVVALCSAALWWVTCRLPRRDQ